MKNKLSKKRGISTVIGGLIFVILLAAGLSVLSIALDSQKNIVDTQGILFDLDLKKQQEDFKITAFKITNDLHVYVTNKGQNPIKINTVWYIDNDNVNQTAYRNDVSYQDSQIMPGEILKDIFPNGLSPQTSSNNLKIKAISSLGNIATTTLSDITSEGEGNLYSKLLIIPPTITPGENVTISMLVTNTGTESVSMVQPNTLNIDPAIYQPGTLSPNPSPISELSPSESTLFSWKFLSKTGIAQTSTIASQATGIDDTVPIYSNNATDKIRIGPISGDDIIIIDTGLLSRPEMFIVKPGPFGNSGTNEPAVWGVNVVNPTNRNMTISKITVSLISPRANSQDTLFLDSGASNKCVISAITPSDITKWNCVSTNQLVWKDTSAPLPAGPFSIVPFLVKVNPGEMAGSTTDMESLIIHVSVVTSFGEFGKSGYVTSFRNAGNDGALVNVYLSDSNTVSGAMQDVNIKSMKTDIPSGSRQSFNVAFVNFPNTAPGADMYIATGAHLIINIPKNWKNINVDSSTGFSGATPVTFTDGSSQIIATTTSNIPLNDARFLTFSADAPSISSNPAISVMYILANGHITDGSSEPFPIGPMAEIVLKVIP